MKKLTQEMVRHMANNSPNWNVGVKITFQFEGWDVNFIKQGDSDYCLQGIREDKRSKQEFTSCFDKPEEAVLYMLNDFGTKTRFSNWENALLRHEAFKEYNSRIVFFYYDEEFEDRTYYTYIIDGLLTEEQEEQILNCLDDYKFVPDDVGIDNCEWGEWHELDSIDQVSEAAGNAMTPDEIVQAFQRMYSGWHEASPDVSDQRPYLVEITDRATQVALIWAESQEKAAEYAEARAKEGIITFDNTVNREFVADVQHIATADDVRRMTNY